MSVLRVLLNKLSSDWQFARTILEDEFKAIGTSSSKCAFKTRYEFVLHLLDVHRMSCDVCPIKPESFGVHSNRDSAVDESALPNQGIRKNYVAASSRTKDRLHKDGLKKNSWDCDDDESNNDTSEMALPSAMTCNGELETDNNTCMKLHHGIESKNTDQKGEDKAEGLFDNSRPSGFQVQIPDDQSNLESVNQVSYILIKQEESSEEYGDVNSSANESTHSHEESDLLRKLKTTNEVPILFIKEEEDSQEHLDVDISLTQLSSHHSPKGVPTQRIESDILSHFEMTGLVPEQVKQKGNPHDCCDEVDTASNESTTHERDEEPFPMQDSRSDTDGKTIFKNINEPSTSTQECDISYPESISMDQCEADEKTITSELSTSTQDFDISCPECSSQDLYDASMESSKIEQNTSRTGLSNRSECPLCNKKYTCKRALDIHLQTHSNAKLPSLGTLAFESTFSCSIGNDTFKTNHYLSKHMRTHTGENPHQCLGRSKITDQSGEENVPVRTQSGDKPFKCELRSSKCSRKGCNLNHRYHKGKKPDLCSVCGKRFPHKTDFIRHMRTHTGEKPYVCSICGKRFAQNSALKTHMRIHTGERPYQCCICEKAFITNPSLSLHMRAHTEENLYKCSVCNNTFTQNSALKRHMRIHTGERWVQCSICEKSFRNNYSLSLHMRTHTGERPFQCPVCKKRFTLKSCLKGHMRTHTGEMPYTCAVCNKSFSQKLNLKTHMRSHTGEMRYQCSFCDKMYVRKDLFSTHMRTHTGGKPFQCLVCKKRYTTNSALKKHVKTHTG